MTYSAPYHASGGRVLQVECGASLFAMQQTLISLARILISATVLILLLALVGGYFLMALPLRPLAVLTENAERIGRKEMGKRLPVIPTGDELERLTHSLNGMIDRLEEALAHNYRFSADASHELRTPLTILRGEMEEMLLLENLPSQAVENLVSSIEEVDRMSKIVNSLMAITRLDAGGERMAKRVFNLSELARTTVEHVRLLAEEKAVTLTISGPGEVFVEADPMRMKQVLVNLLDNAIKYTPAGRAASEAAPTEQEDDAAGDDIEEKEISIAVRAVGSQALLQIHDHGIGILPDALPHVFDRFYRADYARNRVTGGVGLGLAIVKAIITAHDGTVSIESVVGEETTVTVRLPLAHSPAGTAAAVDLEPSGSSRHATELSGLECGARSQPAYGTNVSSEIPNARNATRNVTTMNPIMRRMRIPAMARRGSAKNGCSILATDSPMATDMVVPASEACSLTAAGIANGPCTAQCPPPEGTNKVITSDVR
jgi:signal transduction histidine kinase